MAPTRRATTGRSRSSVPSMHGSPLEPAAPTGKHAPVRIEVGGLLLVAGVAAPHLIPPKICAASRLRDDVIPRGARRPTLVRKQHPAVAAPARFLSALTKKFGFQVQLRYSTSPGVFSLMMSIASRVHSSQMQTYLGPAIIWPTSQARLPQNEQARKSCHWPSLMADPVSDCTDSHAKSFSCLWALSIRSHAILK